MWFWFAIIALLCWSGSDLFSKIGCRDNDKYAHLKMVIAVGVVMGLHAAFEIFVQGSSIELSADGPIRPPYAVYFQGGLTWYHAKLGILMSLQKMVESGLVTLKGDIR